MMPLALISADELLWDTNCLPWAIQVFISVHDRHGSLLCHCVVDRAGVMGVNMILPEIAISGRKVFLRVYDSAGTCVLYRFEDHKIPLGAGISGG